MVGYGSTQADMVLTVLHLNPQATGSQLFDFPFSTPSVASSKRLQSPPPQRHTSSKNTIPIPTRPDLLIVPLPMEAIFKSSQSDNSESLLQAYMSPIGVAVMHQGS